MELNSAWLKPRQRILQRHGHRISIRLEEEFWEQLEFSAKDEGLKLSELVFRLIDENSSTNRSSLLRTYCARWMRKKLIQAHISHTNADIQGILTSCPIPCVIVSREKKLIAQNGVFGEKILGALVSPDIRDKADTIVRFSLGRPVDRIISDLVAKDTPFIETNVAFSRGSAIVQMIGRFCLLNPRISDTSPLLCFLDPHRSPR